MRRYPSTTAVWTALTVSSGELWNTPRPIAGIWTPLFSVSTGLLGLILPSQAKRPPNRRTFALSLSNALVYSPCFVLHARNRDLLRTVERPTLDGIGFQT